jgi:hypothetical protein
MGGLFGLDLKTFHDSAMHEMLLDNLIDIFLVYIGVPDGVWVNYRYRAFLATIHATGGINPNTAFLAGNTQILGTLLGIIPHGL